MVIDPNDIAQPQSPEMVSGGSYMPQEPSNVPRVETGIADRSALEGRARDVNDFNLTMSGIADGDPVGMETFDLGFFEDGTPAITINGANVPIRHEQWMALLTMRNRTRAEVRSRMEFEHNKRKAKDGINRILASAPSVPPQLGQLLLTIADMDPGVAVQETQQLLVSMSQDNGRRQIGKLSTMIQDTAVESEMSRLRATIEEPVLDARGQPRFDFNTQQPVVTRTNRISKRMAELSKDSDPRKRTTAFAISNIDSMFPPKGMKADPAVGGKPIGIFDIMVNLDGGDTSELSRFELLRNLAAYSDLWPVKVDWVDTPVSPDSALGVGINPNDAARYRNYLLKLDQWASTTLKWDRSDPRAIDMMVERAILGNRSSYNPNQQPAQQGANQTQQSTPAKQGAPAIEFGS